MSIIQPSAQNPHLKNIKVDHLYHFGLDTSMDLAGTFGDTKYVVMSGSPTRVHEFALKANEHLGLGLNPEDIKPHGKTERFRLYKVGPVISVSHGMGMPSAQIMLHELTKLLEYAGASDVAYVRIGTSGGIGLAPGTVAITTEAVNGKLNNEFEQIVLGETRTWPTMFDQALSQELYDARGDYMAALGRTLSTNDFYEEEGHLDGALEPGYTEQDVQNFNKRLQDENIICIEMESLALAAFTQRAGIPCAMVSATLTDRFAGDQIDFSKEELAQFSENARQVVLNWLKMRMGK